MADPIIFELGINASALQTQITEAIKAAGRAAAKLRIPVDTEFIKDQVRAAIAAARTGLPSITAAPPPGARVGIPGAGAVVLPSLAAPAIPGAALPPSLPPGAGVRGAVPISVSAADVSVKGVQPKVAKAIREALRSLQEIKHRPKITIDPKKVVGARAIQAAVKAAVAKLGALKPKIEIQPDVKVTAITREARVQILQQVRALLAPLQRPGIVAPVTIHPVVRTGKARGAARALAGTAGALGGVFGGLKNIVISPFKALVGVLGLAGFGLRVVGFGTTAVGLGLAKIGTLGLRAVKGVAALGQRVIGLGAGLRGLGGVAALAFAPLSFAAVSAGRGLALLGLGISGLGGIIGIPSRAFKAFGQLGPQVFAGLSGSVGQFGAALLSKVPGPLKALGTGIAQVFGGLAGVVKGAAQTIGGLVGAAGKIGGAFVRAGAQITRSLSRILIPPQLAALASFAIPVVGFTAAIIAVKEFAGHQQAILESLTNFTEMLRTLPAGASSVDFLNRSFRSLSNQVTEVSIKFGLSAKSVAQAMFEITSAGVGLRDPTERMEALTAAAKVATGGVADIKESFRGVLGISRSFNVNFERAADVLFAIQRLGIAPVRELAPQIARVSSFAAAAGVSLEELAAAIATASGQTVPLSSVITGLRQTFADFAKGGSNVTQSALAKLTAEFPGFNLQVNAATIRSKGLTGVLQELAKVDQGLVGSVFRRVRSLGVLLPLIQARARFEKNLTDISQSHGDADAAVGIIQGGLANQITRVVEAARLAAIAIGEKIAAVLDLGKRVTSLTASFTELGRSIQAIPNETLKRTVQELLSFKGFAQVVDLLGRSILSVFETIGSSLFGALKSVFAAILTLGKVLGDRLSIIISESISSGLGVKVRGFLGIETPIEEAGRRVKELRKELDFAKTTFSALSGVFEATDKPTQRLRASVEQSRNQVLGLNRQLNEAQSRLALLGRSGGALDLEEGAKDARQTFNQILGQLNKADPALKGFFGSFSKGMRAALSTLRGGFLSAEEEAGQLAKAGEVSKLLSGFRELEGPVSSLSEVLRTRMAQATDEVSGSFKLTVGQLKEMETAITTLKTATQTLDLTKPLEGGIERLFRLNERIAESQKRLKELGAGVTFKDVSTETLVTRLREASEKGELSLLTALRVPLVLGPSVSFTPLSKEIEVASLRIFLQLDELRKRLATAGDPGDILRSLPEIRAAFAVLTKSIEDPQRAIFEFLSADESLRRQLAKEPPRPPPLLPPSPRFFTPKALRPKPDIEQLIPGVKVLDEEIRRRLGEALEAIKDFTGAGIDVGKKIAPELIPPFERLREKLELIKRQFVGIRNEISATGEAGAGVDTVFIRVASRAEAVRADALALGASLIEAGERAKALQGAQVTAQPTGLLSALRSVGVSFFEVTGLNKALVDAQAAIGNVTNSKLEGILGRLTELVDIVRGRVGGLEPGGVPRGARAIRQSQAQFEGLSLFQSEIIEGAR